MDSDNIDVNLDPSTDSHPTEWRRMNIVGRIVIGMPDTSHFRFDKNILQGQLGIGSIDYFNLLRFCGSFSAVEGIFAHRIV